MLHERLFNFCHRLGNASIPNARDLDGFQANVAAYRSLPKLFGSVHAMEKLSKVSECIALTTAEQGGDKLTSTTVSREVY